MGIKSVIKDDMGSSRGAHVTEKHSLLVSAVPPDVPPPGTENTYRYFQGVLGSTGIDSGTTNMNVNGSTTPQSFYVGASEDYDIHVMGIAILIADAGVVHNNFGGVNPLTIGWDLFAVESGSTTNIINKAKTGGQVIAQGGFRNPYGNTADTFELTNWTGTGDAQTIYIPLSEYLPNGLRIGRGSIDRVVSRVNDNLTGLDEFTVRLFGYRHYE